MKQAVDRRPLARILAEECANWARGRCVWGRPCRVLAGERCEYFERAVLPAWPGVAAEYWRRVGQGRLIGVNGA